MDTPTDTTLQVAEGRIEWLTPRQNQVLDLLAQGYSNRAIADELLLGTKSVENYINTLFGVLGLSDIKGRQARVLAALGYHYGVGDVITVRALVGFATASRHLRDARNKCATAQIKFDAASDELKDMSGYQITQTLPPAPRCNQQN